MTCPTCSSPWPAYNVTCVVCCAEMVRQTRPIKPAASAVLFVISRNERSPARKEILSELADERSAQAAMGGL